MPLHVGVESLAPVRRHVRPHLLSLHKILDRRQILDLLTLGNFGHLVHIDADELEKTNASSSSIDSSIGSSISISTSSGRNIREAGVPEKGGQAETETFSKRPGAQIVPHRSQETLATFGFIVLLVFVRTMRPSSLFRHQYRREDTPSFISDARMLIETRVVVKSVQSMFET